MIGAIPPLPQYVSMAGYSVKKAKEQLYFTFLISFIGMLNSMRILYNNYLLSHRLS